MSTKVTIVYANREEHGEDFHLYYDYADFDVPLPSRLKAWIYTVWSLYGAVREVGFLLSRLKDGDYVYPIGTAKRACGGR